MDINNWHEKRNWIYLRLNRICANDGETIRARYEHENCGLMPKIMDVPIDAIVETNIPPRLTGEPMTAGEAAKLPDIVGRWVAVRVESKDEGDNRPLAIKNGAERVHEWLYADAPVYLLPEGFGE